MLRGKWVGIGLNAVEYTRDVIDGLRRTPQDQRRFGSKRVQLNAARRAGFRAKTFIGLHAPYPMRIRTMAEFVGGMPLLFKENIACRFRNLQQFGTEALSNHLELYRSNANVQAGNDVVYIRADREKRSKVMYKVKRIAQDEQVKFLCIQSLDKASPDVKSLLLNWLGGAFINGAADGAPKIERETPQ